MESLNNISAVEVEPLPRAVLQAFSSQFDKSHSKAAEIPEADLSGIDTTLTRSLMPFQQHGVEYVPYTSLTAILIVVQTRPMQIRAD